jgi:hypothetical protein
MQIFLNPDDLVKATGAVVVNIIHS